MSTIQCDSCNYLRENAPEFVQNGVSANVAASLRNNTGVSFNSTNCDDLLDVLDCLIGRMTDELEAYDVCDWKDFMHKHNSNLYETLKAMLMDSCGQWEALCTLLSLIRGDNIQGHLLTWTENGRAKFHANAPFDDERMFLTMGAELKSGIGCNGSRALGLANAGITHTGAGDYYPLTFTYRVENLVIGEHIGYIKKSQVVPTYMTEYFWTNHLIRGGLGGLYALVNNNTNLHVGFRGYAVIDGVEINVDLKDEFGPDVAVLSVTGLVGGSNSGGVIGGGTPIRSYDA